MAGKRALLIVNPRARRGSAPIDAAMAVFEKGGLELKTVSPNEGENASELIARRADHVDFAIVGGGDGTLNAAAAGLVYTGLPLGVLPLGTANDFARTLGIPPDPVKAAELIVAGKQGRSTLGRFLLGSVSSRILSGANCDMLIVPRPRDEARACADNAVLARNAAALAGSLTPAQWPERAERFESGRVA